MSQLDEFQYCPKCKAEALSVEEALIGFYHGKFQADFYAKCTECDFTFQFNKEISMKDILEQV